MGSIFWQWYKVDVTSEEFCKSDITDSKFCTWMTQYVQLLCMCQPPFFVSECVTSNSAVLKHLLFSCFQLDCWPFQLFMFHQRENVHLLFRTLINLCTPLYIHSVLQMCVMFYVVPNQGNAYCFHFVSSFCFPPFSELSQ